MKPHKSASFNTIKKAKKVIVCVVLFCIAYNIPHLFITSVKGKGCIPFGYGKQVFYGLFYYWLSLIINYIMPFILLIIINSVIIHTLRSRPTFGVQGQSQDEGQQSKMKSSEKHIYITLLLVSVGFLILSTPSYVFYLLQMMYDINRTPRSSAAFHFFIQIAGNMSYTNSGINFFLYVLSGCKFRSDLVKLFHCFSGREISVSKSNSSAVYTTGSVVR